MTRHDDPMEILSSAGYGGFSADCLRFSAGCLLVRPAFPLCRAVALSLPQAPIHACSEVNLSTIGEALRARC